jgi:hypothetical protein
MKTVVAVIVFNRIWNIAKWIDCWKKCDTAGAELVVIHNVDTGENSVAMKAMCDEAGIKYIRRQNIGFDIGAFQDVCLGRLDGFPTNWENILWSTDDTIPMQTDFIKIFVDALEKDGVGISCMEISDEVRRHVRTSGICMKKQTAEKLQFPADPMLTKDHCWDFEHRGNNTLLDQITAMGLKAKQCGHIVVSPMWDTQHRASLGRQDEFNHAFGLAGRSPEDHLVTFICPIHNTFPEIVSSLINQTHKNWRLLLMHDGLCNIGLVGVLKAIGDKRIGYMEFEEHQGNWGHYYRRWALNCIDQISPNTDFVVITNADNFHAPVFAEKLVSALVANPAMAAAYSAQMVHSYKAPHLATPVPVGHQTAENLVWKDFEWGVMDCKPERGHIDCAGVMVRKKVAQSVGWRDTETHSADWTYFDDIIARYGEDKWIKVDGCLLVHC